MNGSPRYPGNPNTPPIAGTNWVAAQAEAVRREALAVEYEARTLEIEAGGVIPPFEPPQPEPGPFPSDDPTVNSLAAEAQTLADDSRIVLNNLPEKSKDRAMVKSIHDAAKAFYQKVEAEDSDVTSMDELVDEAEALAEDSAVVLDSLSSSEDRTLVENLRKAIKSFCNQVAANAKNAAD